MANCGKEILLNREGTEQKQRFNYKLDPAWIKLNDFGLEEWMNFAWQFASHINYFDVSDDSIKGNWQDFFIQKEELSNFLKKVEMGGDITPHLALFVTFIKLLDSTKSHFNRLTKRHLDFYYQKVLKLEKHSATPDTVHVLFELAKNAIAEKVDKSASLDAGKDSDGKKLVYSTTDELVANRTKVSSLKSIYNDHINRKIKAADVANSYDGKGADFPDKDIKWWPFGYYESMPESGDPDQREYPELPDARIGFAVSGEILELKEGERNIQLKLGFESQLSKNYLANDIAANIEIWCTGEKGWIGPCEILNQYTGLNGEVKLNSGSNSSDLHKLHFLFRIPKDEKALVSYDKELHEENFITDFPVCRVLFKTDEPDAHDLYRDLVERTLKELNIDVVVSGVENLNLYNDIGALSAGKPFYPFGTQPVKKSKFYVDNPELFKKKWSQLNLNFEWKNTPDNFYNWYYAYRKNDSYQFSSANYVSGIYELLKDSSVDDLKIETKELEFRKSSINEFTKNAEDIVERALQFNTLNNFVVGDNEHFTAAVEINNKEEWVTLSKLKNKPLFEGPEDGIFTLNLNVSNPEEGELGIGPVRLSLNQTFLHEMYPRLYALAMTNQEDDVIIPNEPYTPFVEKLTLDYHATASIKPSGNTYQNKDFDLFHEHPFGQALECIEIKVANDILDETDARKLLAVPTYCKGGELFIGLEKAVSQQTVSLLIQMLEGSENPEAESFVGKQKVEWCMLCNNDWKQLDTTEIISDNTDNLLKTGLLKFNIPKQASTKHTLLPAGMMWLKARIHKNYDVVSKVIGIHAQAVAASFTNNSNSLNHLNDGLPADTISKMVARPPKIKSVAQPYSSFGGQAHETDAAFYRRVSERLRHKNRAITLWDYEHLILQNFQEIHKVKCLNHTSTSIENSKRQTTYLSPGNIVLVVIPDIVNRNVFDIYKPRVSKAILNKVENFLQELNSPLVKLSVINPEYEEVRVDLDVQFNSGFDEVYYKTVLKEDLTRLLSPWAFDNTAAIQFGLSLHKSIIIDYIEKLSYIDFISNVKLFQKVASTGVEKEVNIAAPTSPEAILVSSKAHTVNDAENKCSNQITEPAESCQS